MSHDSLDSFFAPRSIAIVGASDTPMKIGAIPVTYLLRHGYAGRVLPINPGRDTVQGLPAWPTLTAVGEPIDLAIFAVPAQHVAGALDDAIAAGVRNIVMFSAGYAEMGEAGAIAQDALLTRARRHGIRMLGPNCLGFMNIARQAYATFSPVLMAGTVQPGHIAVVSQSGAFGAYAYAMARERGLGLSYWATTGNEADIQVADCIEWLAGDDATRVILAYLEGCRDGPHLRRALAAARAAGKPVVAVKVGRTQAGADAAASHTASLAGDDAVYDAVLRAEGVWRAHGIDEFFNVGYALSLAPLPANRRVGLLTVSGGVGALMADEASLAGLDLAPMPAQAQAWIRAQVPFAAPNNPVDITGQVTSQPELIEQTARLMLTEGGYGSLLVFLAAGGLSDALWPRLQAMAQGLARDFPDRTLVFSSLFSPARRSELQAMGVPAFADPGAAVRALAALAFVAGHRQARGGDTLPIRQSSHGDDAMDPAAGPARQAAADRPEPAPRAVPALPRTAGHDSSAGLRVPRTEPEGLAWLADAGIPVSPWRLASDVQAAVQAADTLGYPVVLKIVSPDIAHKSDVGGVQLGLADADAVRSAFEAMLAGVRQAAPAARLDGVLVMPMAPAGVECILGVQRDPVFGPMVLFGLGGVDVELQRDVSLRPAPLTEAEAHAMMREVRAYPRLTGHRGKAPADLAALARALVALSELACRHAHVAGIDINPFLVLPQGQGALALDALFVAGDTGSTPRAAARA